MTTGPQIVPQICKKKTFWFFQPSYVLFFELNNWHFGGLKQKMFIS